VLQAERVVASILPVSSRGAAASALVLAAVALLAGPAGAVEVEPRNRREAIAEPLVGETVTDIDAEEVGEVEVDLTLLGASRYDRTSFGSGELEAEAKLTSRIGVSIAVELAGDQKSAVGAAGLRLAASCALFHDRAHDVHLQLEAAARVFESDLLAEPTRIDDAAPYEVGLRAAWRRGAFTSRLGLGLSIGGVESVPLWFDVALLGEWGRHGRRSFAGLELLTDWSSNVPLTAIPEVAVGFQLGDVPLRIGVGMPLAVGYRWGDLSVGALLRVMLELDRD
jgi:hypothetical protein